jgi:YVTN family beta-propeller protein
MSEVITGVINPKGMVVNQDNSKLYVVEYNRDIKVINTATDTVLTTITGANGPFGGIAICPDGSRIYVPNFDGTVSVINTIVDTVAATITVGALPFGLSVSPYGNKVYVANNDSNTVSVINSITNTVMATIPVGKSPVAFGNFISIYPSHLGFAPQSILQTISVYPNPVTTTLTIDIPQAAVGNIAIYNLLGEEVYSTTNNKPPTTNNIDVSALPGGVYIVEVKSPQVYKVGKFVKE